MPILSSPTASSPTTCGPSSSHCSTARLLGLLSCPHRSTMVRYARSSRLSLGSKPGGLGGQVVLLGEARGAGRSGATVPRRGLGVAGHLQEVGSYGVEAVVVGQLLLERFEHGEAGGGWSNAAACSRRRRNCSLRIWSVIRRCAVWTSHARGLPGTPSRGQCRAAAGRASWTASSAASKCPNLRAITPRSCGAARAAGPRPRASPAPARHAPARNWSRTRAQVAVHLGGIARRLVHHPQGPSVRTGAVTPSQVTIVASSGPVRTWESTNSPLATSSWCRAA
jgi:hypothetical protein